MTAPALPAILGLRRGDRLPLHVDHRVGSATGERHNVVPDVAGAPAAARSCRGGRAARAEIRASPLGSGVLSPRLGTKPQPLSTKIVEDHLDFCSIPGMRSRQQQKPGRVKVFRFRLYDIASDDFKISARMATAACIRRIHAHAIRRTELEIDKRFLNGDGMTEVGLLERAVLNCAVGVDAVAANGELTSARPRPHPAHHLPGTGLTSVF